MTQGDPGHATRSRAGIAADGASMAGGSAQEEPVAWTSECRTDEDAVRILMVEPSPACASLLRRLLGRARRGHFEVVLAERLSARVDGEIDARRFDAILVDLARLGDAVHEALERASELARRLPVILLTGTEDGELVDRGRSGRAEDPSLLRRLDRADLPATLLRSIRRHRRVGSGGAGPVFCRIPGV